MTAPIHPARQMPFDALLAGLKRACAQGFVWRRPDPASSLALYIYTPRCVYEDGWDEFALAARGLILDEAVS